MLRYRLCCFYIENSLFRTIFNYFEPNVLQYGLTAKYDWTGLSGLFYKSWPLTVLGFILILAAELGFAAHLHFHIDRIMYYGHYFEMFSILGVFTIILLPNIIRMWYFTLLKRKIKAPIKAYYTAISDLIVHMFTQKRSLDCDDNQFRWIVMTTSFVGLNTLS